MTERTTVRLPLDLLRRARRKAAEERRTLTSLIEEGLRLAIAESPKPKRATRVMPRVSTATGGPLPGVDVSDNSAVQELEDLEYVERMQRFK